MVVAGIAALAGAVGNAVSSIFVADAQKKIAKIRAKADVKIAGIRGQTAVTLGVTKQETVTAVAPLAVGIGALVLVTTVLSRGK